MFSKSTKFYRRNGSSFCEVTFRLFGATLYSHITES